METKQHTKAFLWILSFGFIVIVFYLINSFNLFETIPEQTSEAQQKREEQLKEAFQLAPKIGSARNVVLIEYGNFQCPGCKEASATVKTVLEEYGDQIQFIWIHALNRTTYPESESAAIAAQCAHEQGKFTDFHDALFENQDRLGPELYNELVSTLELDRKTFSTCLASPATKLVLENHQQVISTAGITQTPSFTINSTNLEGVPTEKDLRNAIESAL